jgi:hypothetical protein
MNVRLLSTFVFGLALGAAASAQDATTPPPSVPPVQSQGGGQRGEGRGWGGGMGSGRGMGRGLSGTVTEVASDHYTVKTETGDTYIVHFSVNTRIIKQQARSGGEGGAHARGDGGPGGGYGGGGGNPPTPLKPTDIKVGDAIAAMGEVDATAKSVGATVVLQIDPERAKQMREMQANYGKTWLMGKVTAIDGVRVTLMGNIDNTAHSFVADENTTFRKRRDPITLADIQVGDTVRVDGTIKDGTFLAAAVNAMGAPPGGAPNGARDVPPPPQ